MYFTALLLIHLVSGVAGVQWTSPSPSNGATVTACRGQTVSLRWTYSTLGSEQVVDVDWLFRGKDQRQSVLASYDRGNFLVKPNTTKQLSYLPSAGLRLTNVTSEQSGQYSVNVNLRKNGLLVHEYQNVTVMISDPPELVDNKLRVSLIPGRQLSCGVFTSRGTPPVDVVFTTPCKTTHNATSYSNGHFTFTLPTPVTGGDYTCHIAHGPSSRCLSKDAAPITKATTSVYSPSAQAQFERWKSLFGRRPRDCSEVQIVNDTSGVYTIYVNKAPVKVYCDMDTDGGGWTVIQRRQDGSVNFTRHYTQFEAGFGDVGGEFWLGLRHMYQLTTQAEYELRVDMEDWEHNTAYAVYNNFRLADDTDNYRLRLGSLVTGPTRSSFHMSYNNGKQFSALGNDNSVPGDCVATRQGTGWWFKNCSHVNPNGVYLHNRRAKDNVEGEGTIIWDSFRGHVYSLKRIEMKIRKHNR